MILTFELQGESLDIHFDVEGREVLKSMLSIFGDEPDHYHLFMEPFGKISAKRYDTDSKAIECVTFVQLPRDAQPVE